MNIQQKIAKLTWWNEIIKLKDILRELASNMFVPTNYDLSEFTNNSGDPFVRDTDLSPYQLISRLQQNMNSSAINYPSIDAVRIALGDKENNLPDQSGNSGKVLGTNGSAVSWVANSGSTPTLQEVTDVGYETTNPLIYIGGSVVNQFGITGVDLFDGAGSSTTYGNNQIVNNGYGYCFPDNPLGFGNNVIVTTEEKTISFTALNSVSYTANGTITVTDPTPVANKGYIVHVIGGTSTIGGVGYTTGALVYRFYDGITWVSKDYAAGGGGVTTVTGPGVDNTDPTNPIVNLPTATDIDALKRDGSNANTDVNIGGNNFFANGIKSDGNNVLTEVSTTASLAPSTDRNYQTDTQQTNNDATSSIQGQLNNRLLISDNKLKEVGSFNQTVTAVTTVTVTLTTSQPDTLYKVNVTPTNLLASTTYYISSKTTGNFVLTYATALTGAVSGDYTIYHN